jgi:predicted RNase H-like HicB family nuclease
MKMEKQYITMTIKLPIKVVKKRRWYVASCPVLDVFSQGETEKEAIDNLSEALSLFLISCLERGTLEQVLRECGFNDVSPEIVNKPTLSKKRYIDIPLSLLSNHKVIDTCLA